MIQLKFVNQMSQANIQICTKTMLRTKFSHFEAIVEIVIFSKFNLEINGHYSTKQSLFWDLCIQRKLFIVTFVLLDRRHNSLSLRKKKSIFIVFNSKRVSRSSSLCGSCIDNVVDESVKRESWLDYLMGQRQISFKNKLHAYISYTYTQIHACLCYIHTHGYMHT